MAEDTVLTVAAPGVLGNDTDADGDTLTALLVSEPAQGTLSLNADGSFTYTPAPNFNGTDQFTYQASDGALTSNVATVTLTVTEGASADLSITKSDDPDPVIVGQPLTYTLTVTNRGPSPATGVTVADTLPSGVIFVSAAPSQGTCSGTSTVTCDLETLAADADATVTITVQPTAVGTLTNTASVEGSEDDPDTADNTDTEPTEVSPIPLAADLAVTKEDSPDPVLAGGELIYTLTVSNNGPSNATGVTVTDELPAGVTFTSASASPGSCSGTGPVTCSLGTLATGANATVTITVRPTEAGLLTNTASVSGAEADPNTANNTETEPTSVNPAADLVLTKADAPDPVAAGAELTYTITVRNNGPSPATGVTVTDTLPGGVTFVSASSTQVSCSGTSTVTCSLGTLANGASTTVTIKVQPTASGTLTNTASVRGTETDPNPANNAATTSTTVTTTTTSGARLSVSVQGQGTVTSDPAGISCRPSCSAQYPRNTSVTLTATPANGRQFVGWGGACTGPTPTCTVTMTENRTVQATFK